MDFKERGQVEGQLDDNLNLFKHKTLTSEKLENEPIIIVLDGLGEKIIANRRKKLQEWSSHWGRLCGWVKIMMAGSTIDVLTRFEMFLGVLLHLSIVEGACLKNIPFFCKKKCF